MNTALPRFALHFLAICFLAWTLFLPGGATAAGNTITSGAFTNIYGNTGDATTPTDATSNTNSLTLGDGSSGPTISGTSAMTIAGGQAPGTPNGNADNNALTISGGTSLEGSGTISLFGGRVQAGSGTASDNTVTITSFTQSNDSVFVYGGRSEGTGNVLDNTVGIASGNTNNFMTVYGGYATSGAATGNIVTIDGGGQIENVVGGYAYSGNAGGSGAGNIVNVTGGNANILYGLTGGRSTSGSASYNEVQIGNGYAGTIGGGVNGGWVVSGSGNAEHNSVVINGGTIQGGAAVIGGQSTNGAATGNSVTITGGTVGGNIHGGETSSGSATDNTVTITTTGKTYQNIYGGYTSWNTSGDLFTGNTLNLNTGNTVSSVHNMATLNFTSGGNAGVGLLDTTATGASGNPLVTINTNANAVTLGGVIFGTGGIDKTGAGTLTLTGTNTYSGGTTVTTGTLAGNIAANTDLTVASGATYDGTGAARTVNALNGAGDIINGSGLTAQSGTFSGVISGAGFLTKTGVGTLSLSGANTYTGMTEVRAGTLALTGSLVSNLLTLHSGTTFDASGVAHSLDNGALHVHGQAAYIGDLSAQNALLNFYVPTTMSNGGTMLSVGGTADITGSTVNVGIEGGSSPLAVGDTLTLIDSTGLSATGINTTANGQGMQGVTLKYEFDLTTTSDRLLATVSNSGPTVNEQTKALSEGWLSGMALVNQGADAAAGAGMNAAIQAAQNAGNAFAGFGSFSGGRSRYNTGSHVDVSGVSLLTGLSYGMDLTPGRLTLGAFFEYGNGSYDTHNSFSTAASVKGDGDMYYIGGGILGRMDFGSTGPGHFYAESSLRAGKVHNEYDSSDLQDAMGRKAEYDSSSAYYSLHLGTGYIWNITEAASLDMYGKYFWTRQEGDSVTLSTGDPVRFKDVDSHRLRFGSRFAYAVNEYISPYVGAAYEHEFDGKARASTNGYAIDAPDLKGGTGIGELGLTLKPSQTLPLAFDLGVQGYTGIREGVTGSLQVKFEF